MGSSPTEELWQKLFLGALLLALATLASAAELRGVVVGVADGDTPAVLDASRKQHKIRITVHRGHLSNVN